MEDDVVGCLRMAVGVVVGGVCISVTINVYGRSRRRVRLLRRALREHRWCWNPGRICILPGQSPSIDRIEPEVPVRQRVNFIRRQEN